MLELRADAAAAAREPELPGERPRGEELEADAAAAAEQRRQRRYLIKRPAAQPDLHDRASSSCCSGCSWPCSRRSSRRTPRAGRLQLAQGAEPAALVRHRRPRARRVRAHDGRRAHGAHHRADRHAARPALGRHHRPRSPASGAASPTTSSCASSTCCWRCRSSSRRSSSCRCSARAPAIIIVTIGVLFTPVVSRTVRAAVIGEREREYVMAARLARRTLGVRHGARDPAQHHPADHRGGHGPSGLRGVHRRYPVVPGLRPRATVARLGPHHLHGAGRSCRSPRGRCCSPPPPSRPSWWPST